MLNTLLKIGEWQSQGKSEWDRILDKPKLDNRDKKGNEIKYYVLRLIFDLDLRDVIIDSANLYGYNEKLINDLKALKIQGGNNKAIYVTVPAVKLNQIYKTFFGRENKNTSEGEIAETFRKEDKSLLTNNFESLLKEIFLLKNRFLERTTDKEKGNINLKSVTDELNLGKNESLALITIEVKSHKFFGKEGKLFAEIPEYINLLKHKFINNTGDAVKSDSNAKLCYASGEYTNDVESLNLSSRYSLNKMFVEETKNYASSFDKNKFHQNYQVSRSNQEKLDYASHYILKESGLNIRIANVPHVVIPQFMDSEKVDLELAMSSIKTKSDLLFDIKALDSAARNMEDELDYIFWLNFMAYESNGNFFKTTEQIKDVSSFHFQKILKVFTEVDWNLREQEFVNWDSVMDEFGKGVKSFNFNTIYKLIPIRQENKNKALELFKTILENRKVDKYVLFQYFCEFILCHYYERYNSYENIANSSRDYLSKSIRDGVFKYLAFLQVLKKLNLIDMNEENNQVLQETTNKYENAIHDFFIQMQLNKPQQAMFYLGRMLNSVEFIQKGKKKTVIEKVNFNGMDRDAIQRLRISLIEKAKQYNRMGSVIFLDRSFGELFAYNNWKMNPQEAVFFLLTGYSFGISKKEADNLENTETQNS